MLHDWEQFDVRVAKLFDVGNQLIAELFIAEPAVVVLWNAAPRAKMHFVHRNRHLVPVRGRAALHPRLVLPLVMIEPRNHRAGIRPQLAAEPIWIRFEWKDI